MVVIYYGVPSKSEVQAQIEKINKISYLAIRLERLFLPAGQGDKDK